MTAEMDVGDVDHEVVVKKDDPSDHSSKVGVDSGDKEEEEEESFALIREDASRCKRQKEKQPQKSWRE